MGLFFYYFFCYNKKKIIINNWLKFKKMLFNFLNYKKFLLIIGVVLILIVVLGIGALVFNHNIQKRNSQISKMPPEISNDHKFDLESLKQVKPYALFDRYPQTVCVIKNILGDKYEEIQRKKYESGLSGLSLPWEIDDLDGGILHISWSWQKPAYDRLLWVHPNGIVVVGINDEEKREITFFSNSRKVKDKQPHRITKWLEYLESERYNYHLPEVMWMVPFSDELYFPDDCQTNALAEDIKNYLTAQKGESCSVNNLHNIVFEQRWPYLIKTDDSSNRAFLRKNPDRSENITEDHLYLVDGDMVQLVRTEDFEISEKNGFVCAFYRSFTGKETMGWIEKEKVIRMSDDVKNDEVDSYFINIKRQREWPSKLFYNEQIYPGSYTYTPMGIDKMKNPSTITIEVLNGKLEVKSSIHQKFRLIPLDEFLSGNFRIIGDALAEYKTEGGCHAKLYLFNNGVYLIDQEDKYGIGPCLLGIHGVAIFYPI